MVEQSVKIGNSFSDARDVALLVQTAGKFVSRIQIEIDNKKINAKSIMGTISLGIEEGQIAKIIAEGKDENDAVSEMINALGKN